MAALNGDTSRVAAAQKTVSLKRARDADVTDDKVRKKKTKMKTKMKAKKRKKSKVDR